MDIEKIQNRHKKESKKKMYMDLKDIVREHSLPFLPAKSLLKFRAVCWDWNRWILSPFLAHNQSYLFHDISGFFCQSREEAPPSFISLDQNCYGIPDPSLEFLKVPVNIKASSNGLVCCQARSGDTSYYVCNPLTKQFRAIPNPSCHHGDHPALVLIFEPSLLSFAANFKLVCAFPSSDFDDGHEFEIYSSETGSWKLSGEICFGKRTLVPDSGVHVKGIVYWVSNNYIVAFDLTKDRSRLIESYYMERGFLGEMKGELCYVNISNQKIVVRILSNAYSNTMGMSSSSMGIGGSGYGMWAERHHIVLNDVPAEKRAVVLFAGGNVVVAEGWESNSIISYDIKTKKTTIVSRPSRPSTERYIPYVNSLVSLI